METLKKVTTRFWPALFATLRYITYNALLSYHQWHIAVKDSWSALTDWDKINVSCNIGLSVLVALGAVMNDKWSRARNENNKPTS